MNAKIALAALAAFASCAMTSTAARAQDVPGIEICTAEKTMERRTSCLQSNVDFLQRTISKLTTEHQQRLDAANRQIEALKSAIASLQKRVDELMTAKKTEDENLKKADTPPAKDAPATKEKAK
jgi:prefoldin subunit 5